MADVQKYNRREDQGQGHSRGGPGGGRFPVHNPRFNPGQRHIKRLGGGGQPYVPGPKFGNSNGGSHPRPHPHQRKHLQGGPHHNPNFKNSSRKPQNNPNYFHGKHHGHQNNPNYIQNRHPQSHNPHPRPRTPNPHHQNRFKIQQQRPQYQQYHKSNNNNLVPLPAPSLSPPASRAAESFKTDDNGGAQKDSQEDWKPFQEAIVINRSPNDPNVNLFEAALENQTKNLLKNKKKDLFNFFPETVRISRVPMPFKEKPTWEARFQEKLASLGFFCGSFAKYCKNAKDQLFISYTCQYLRDCIKHEITGEWIVTPEGDDKASMEHAKEDSFMRAYNSLDKHEVKTDVTLGANQQQPQQQQNIFLETNPPFSIAGVRPCEISA